MEDIISSVPNLTVEQTRCKLRPKLTADLVLRLENNAIDPKEKEALLALSKEMVKVFQDERRLSYAPEAVALAPVTIASSYQMLFREFENAIIKGTADGSIPEPQLLRGFTRILRCANDSRKAELNLGSVMNSLQKRLNYAVEQADPQTQYQLINALSSVLDAMIDIKTSGLSREKLHEPLLKQLRELRKHPELRLAQSASYAHQALLGIPNDEGPYKALLRISLNIVGGTAQILGAVSTMDPAKLLDGLLQQKEWPSLVSCMINVVKELPGTLDSFRSVLGGFESLQKQKSWYIALRFTCMLIQARAFNALEQFIGRVPCKREPEFLCGVCAQLEEAWDTKDSSTKYLVTDFVKRVLQTTGSESRDPRVQAWIRLCTSIIVCSEDDNLQHTPQSWVRQRRKKMEYLSSISFEKTNDEPLPSDLLNKAWSQCITAQVFYADIKIREHYLRGDRSLKVERLTGEELAMDQCYINLAITTHTIRQGGEPSQGVTQRQSSPFQLLARLKVESPDPRMEISLPFLFDSRKIRDNKEASPERILIRGQAGVGKTTLCKKIVHDVLHMKLWNNRFDRILWIPLRTLKGRLTPGYKLEEWLREEYFRAEDGEILAAAIQKAIHDPTKYGKTLFILDGLDEVSREFDHESCGLLHDLLRYSSVIITSRPGTSLAYHINDIDLELETVGFHPDEVQDYIDKNVPDQAGPIKSFIKQHRLVQGLVRIPIQLEALCFCWDTSTVISKRVPTTMTTLYEEINRKLWKKDVVRLEKKFEDKPLSAETARSMHDSEISSMVMQEVCLLQCLAFTGLYNDIIEFDIERQRQIWHHWSDLSRHLEKTGTLPSSPSLQRLSFLRTSDSTATKIYRSYHFLHLTFQEFFAAQFFVQHWKYDNLLPCLEFSSGKVRSPNAREFLLKEKYNTRYNIFWRFVTGLLQNHSDETQICRFFRTIEEEPHDLLGSTHERFFMHCLSEVIPTEEWPKFNSLLEKLENRLVEWLSFEHTMTGLPNLACAKELPERILGKVLQQASERIKLLLLSSMRQRPVTTSIIMDLLALWLKSNISRSLIVAILHFLRGRHEIMLDNIFKSVAALIDDPDEHVRHVVKIPFQFAQKLPDDVLKSLAAQFNDADGSVRAAVIKVFQSQHILPVLKPWTARFNDPDESVRAAAMYLFKYQQNLPDNILKSVAALLDDPDEYVRAAAVEMFEKQQNLPDDILKVIKARFDDPVESVREAVIEVFRNQHNLPDDIVKSVAALLGDPVEFARAAAVKVFRNQHNLPDDIVKSVAALLGDPDESVREAAIYFFRKQQNLSDDILKSVAALLGDPDESVREAALKMFEKQQNLPDDILKVIKARFDDPVESVREAVIEVFRNQHNLPDDIVKSVVALLGDPDKSVREAAVEMLEEQQNLSDDILKSVAALFGDPDESVRAAAICLFREQQNLSDDMLNSVAALFKNSDGSVRAAAIYVFRNRQNLPEDIPKSVAALLGDPDKSVRAAAVEMFQDQHNLSDDILKSVAALFGDPDKSVRAAAISLFRKQQNLSDDMLNSVAALLGDPVTSVRAAAMEMFRDQHNLPDDILKSVAALLSDPDRYIIRVAIDTLIKHQALSRMIIDEFTESLYFVLLKRSFREQSIWYIQDGFSFISTGFGDQKTYLEGEEDVIMDRIRARRKSLGVPWPEGLGM